MLKQIVTGAALACLIAGAAYAADKDADDTECTQQLTKAEEVVHDKIESNALSEAEAEKVNELLDEADALCTEGNFKEASATLDSVNKLVAKGN